MSTSFPSIGSPTLLTGNADPSGTTMDRGGAPAPDQGGSPLTTDGGSYVEGESTQSPPQGNEGGGGDDTGSTQNAGSGSTTGTGGSNPQNQGMGALNGQTWAQGANSPGGFPGQGLHRGTNPDNPPPGHGQHGNEDQGNWGKPGKGGDGGGKETGRTGPLENQATTAGSTDRLQGGTDALTKPLTTIIDQTGRIVSQLGSALLGGDKPATSTILHTPTNTLSRPDPGITSPRPGAAGDSMGRVTAEPTARGGLTGHTDGPVLARGAAEASNPQAALNGRNTGAQTPGNATPASSSNTQPPGTQQQAPAQQTSAQQQAAQQAALLKDGIQAAAAQALLGGLAGQTAQSLAAQPQTPAQLMQGADARAMQGAPFAQANSTQSQVPLQEKPQTLTQQPAQQQNTTRGDKELRNPQQLPAEARQRQEPGATDRALTKQTAEPQGRTLVDARNAEAQARAKGLRDGADARRTGLAENTRQTVNENAKRNELAGTERRPASAMASLRHALDWVGQQARGIGADARTDEEGATTMRVVAGLVVAAVFVGVAIAVLYALRVAFVP